MAHNYFLRKRSIMPIGEENFKTPENKIQLTRGTTLTITPTSTSLAYTTTPSTPTKTSEELAIMATAPIAATTSNTNPTITPTFNPHQAWVTNEPSPCNINPRTPSTVTFLNTEEIQKFRGRRLQTDEVFQYGPTFNEFADSLDAYFTRHNLSDDNEKINALRLLVHPSQGDARYVLAHFLDPALNKERFSYDELIRCLKRSYTTKEEINFYQASQHLINLITNKSNPRDFKNIHEIENAIKLLIDTFKRRENFANSGKTAEQHVMEVMLHLALSYWGGEKLTLEVLEKAPTREQSSLLGLRCSEFLLKDTFHATVNHVKFHQEQRRPSDLRGGAPLRDSRLAREKTTKPDESKDVFCYKCGLKYHRAPQCRRKNLYCNHCRTNTHNSIVCRKKFRQSFNNTYIR